jgi:periplasmic protein TonB
MIGDTQEGPNVKRFILVLMVLACAQALRAQTDPPREEPSLQAPDVVSVTDIPVPILSVANGTVVFEIPITKTGETTKIEVRRDIVSLTDVAMNAVEGWKFSPATLAGEPIASRITVAVTFRPPPPASDPVTFPPLISQSEAAVQAEFQPPEVIHAEFPRYTTTTFTAGAVVLLVNLNEKGEAGESKVLLDLPPFTGEAKAVLGQWRFMAATFNGKPVPSKIVLAFVSRPPPSTPPL